MTPAGTKADLRAYLRRFAGDRKAVSAVEFALILPFMIFTYVGSAELGDGLAIYFKVTEAARTVADLTSQYVTIDPTNMSRILGASATVVEPYSSAGMSRDRFAIKSYQCKRPGHHRLELHAQRHLPDSRGYGANQLADTQRRFDHLWRSYLPLCASHGLCGHRYNQYVPERLFLSAIVELGDINFPPF